MLHLFGVAARRGSPIAAGAGGRRLAAAATALGGVERRGPVLRLGDGDAGVLGAVLVEHHLLLAFEHEGPLRSHHHFAVIAEAVAVDRGVGDNHLLVLVLLVARSRIFVHAVDVVVDFTVSREDAPVADGRHGQRLHLLPVAAHRRHEDPRRVELMAAKLGHQAAAGAVPEPPADQFLERRPRRAVAEGHLRVAKLLRVDILVEDLGLHLGDPLLERIDVGRLGVVEILLPAGELFQRPIVARHRRLPGILAGEIAAVPLGPDRVEIAEELRLADRVDGVVVEDAVVSLMAGGEDLAGVARHPPHLLALVDRVPHQLLGEDMLPRPHRLDGGDGVEVERQRDHDRFDVGIGKKILIGPVNLDVLLRLVLGLPLVLRHQPRPGGVGARARDVAVEGAEDVVGADVGDRDHLEVVGGVGAQQHAPLVAGAEDSDPQRVTDTAAVAEVERAEAGPRREPRGDGAAEEVAARHFDNVAEVLFADLLLAFRQVHPRTLSGFGPHHEAQHDLRK